MNWNLGFDGVCRVMLNNYLVRREIVVSFQKRVDPNRRLIGRSSQMAVSSFWDKCP